MTKSIVVKIGGSTLGSHDTTLEDLVALQREGTLPVVVHGGGERINQWMSKQGIPARFEKGLRVTDAPSLEVVAAVLAGLVNKELVASLLSLGGRAVGLSGADGALIEARVKDPALGFVGEVTRVNPEPLEALLGAGYIPVVAPLGLGETLLNVNADTVAGEIACALGAEGLIFLTDVPGLLDGEGSLIRELSPSQAKALLGNGVASGGMIPKLEACLRCVGKVGACQIIDGRSRHALLAALEDTNLGTRIAAK